MNMNHACEQYSICISDGETQSWLDRDLGVMTPPPKTTVRGSFIPAPLTRAPTIRLALSNLLLTMSNNPTQVSPNPVAHDGSRPHQEQPASFPNDDDSSDGIDEQKYQVVTGNDGVRRVKVVTNADGGQNNMAGGSFDVNIVFAEYGRFKWYIWDPYDGSIPEVKLYIDDEQEKICYMKECEKIVVEVPVGSHMLRAKTGIRGKLLGMFGNAQFSRDTPIEGEDGDTMDLVVKFNWKDRSWTPHIVTQKKFEQHRKREKKLSLVMPIVRAVQGLTNDCRQGQTCCG